MYKVIDLQQVNNNQTFFDKAVHPDLTQCKYPWNTITVNQFGNVYICQSPAWLPKSIGTILDYDDLFELLNNSTAINIRSDMLAQRYFYCNNNICAYFGTLTKKGFKQTPNGDSDLLEVILSDANAVVNTVPNSIIFDFDFTCNFQCPSCRTTLINNNNSEINKILVDKIKTLIIDRITDEPVEIRWAGGEPFISRAYLELWEYIADSGKTNIRNIIQTNGSYIKKKLDLVQKFLPYIDSIRISFDAGTKETYEVIRKNGNWETLLENSKILLDLIKATNYNINVSSDFVTQLGNWKEIPEYVEITEQLGFDKINISKMWNWDTWDSETFNSLNVSDSKHNQYNDFLNIIRQYKENRKINLTYWKNELQTT